MNKSNTKYKDRLFCSIFGQPEHKDWLLSIVNAISNSHYTMDDEMEITTLDDVIFIKMKNDVSFLLDNQMFLFEHQSTFCPNMPLRGLLYFTQLFESHLEQTGQELYSSKLVKIPSPRFYVFYNGSKEVQDRSVLKLSDAFIDPNEDFNKLFEWSAIMLNINYGHNRSILNNCQPLQEYSRYVKMVRDGVSNKLSLTESVEKAVDYAIAHNFLNGYFKKWRGDVMLKSMYEFDEEKYKRIMREEGREEGRKEGRKEGREEGLAEGRSKGLAEGRAEGLQEEKVQVAKNALKMGLPIEQISELTSLEISEIQCLI